MKNTTQSQQKNYKVLYQPAKKNNIWIGVGLKSWVGTRSVKSGVGACSMKVGWERVLSMLGRNVASSEVAYWSDSPLNTFEVTGPVECA